MIERRPRVIGITGSVGKTTTKEAIAAVLQSKSARDVVGLADKSTGNLNTEIGLPLAILGYDQVPSGFLGWLGLIVSVPIRTLVLLTIARYPAILILEYAADRPGDISRLVRIARPEVAVITAVGPAHLEQFRSVLAVAKEKQRLAEAVPPTGLVVLGRDNTFTAAMDRGVVAPVRKVPGRGRQLAEAIAQVVADYFHIPRSDTRAALKDFRAVTGRLEVKRRGKAIIIDDTYNANPLSMELALDTLVELAPTGSRKVAILGYMAELGESSERYHIEIGRLARSRVDLLIGVGKYAILYDADFWYPTSSTAAREVRSHLRPTDTILVKGSRSAAMEKVVAALIGKEENANH